MKTLWNIIKTIGVIVLFFIMSCGGGGESGGVAIPAPTVAPVATPTPAPPPPPPPEPVDTITIIGDSLAYNLALDFTKTVENLGVCGQRLEEFTAPDREFGILVIWHGTNNVIGGDTADEIKARFSEVYEELKADHKICIGLPKYAAVPDKWDMIEDINLHIKDVCGEGFIDAWSVTNTFYAFDNVHPDVAMNRLIQGKVMELLE